MPKKTRKKIGGFAFYLGLIALPALAVLSVAGMVRSFEHFSVVRTAWFVVGCFAGWSIATLLSNTRLEVLQHELKHAVVALLCGNKWKRLNLSERKLEGSFEYAYTKKTAHMNAFIALAPYWFPLITLGTLPIIIMMRTNSIEGMLLGLGITYAIDVYTGVTDIGPHQSDFNNIIGGYYVGLVHVLMWHIILFSFIVAFVLNDVNGLIEIGNTYFLITYDVARWLIEQLKA